MYLWSNTRSLDVDIAILAQIIREAGRPVHVNKLARGFVQARLLTERKHECEADVKTREARRYNPSATYIVGDKVRWKGKLGEVKAVRNGENPRQGQFNILTLVFPDGMQIRLAANPGGEEIQNRRSISDGKVRTIVREHGLAIRTAIQDAMGKDARFVWFEDTQEENWCLTEMLPEVQDKDLAKVFPLLKGLLKDGILLPRPTEELVEAIWGQSNDGSDEYALRAFALNAELQRCSDTRWMGNGWALESEWQKLQEREALVSPRQPSKIELPEGVTLDTSDDAERTAEEIEEEEEPEEEETPIPEDLEAWRRNRRLHATFTLRANHYYGNYLPLNKDMRRVFPPRASEADAVTFYHRFGGEEESFQAWVDWSQRRILGSPQMYQAFYDYGIYPGAVLIISHRGNEQEYDIRTKPPTKDEPVRVRRVFFATDEYGNRILDEDGHPKLEYEEIDEPRRYEVADDVFIVGASWENLPELFAEAERVGQGYFRLMCEVCREWEANGRKPLYVTADELFQEIHYNRRLVTSEATIRWELWRRLAFKPVGDGRYLFRREMGDRIRAIRPGKRPARTPKPRRGVMVKRDKSLLEIAGKARVKISVSDTDSARGVKTVKEGSQDYSFPTAKDWQNFYNRFPRDAPLGWKVVHQRKIKGYFKTWSDYLEYLDTHPSASDAQIEEETGIHWRGTMHIRYLGLVDENRSVTAAGRAFYKEPQLRNALLQQQVEKWYYCVGNFFRSPDYSYRIYPFFFVLQVLLNLGDTDKPYSISCDEFRYFVITAKEFSEWRERISLIKDYRRDMLNKKPALEEIFANTYWNRIIQMLEISEYFRFTNDSIQLVTKHIITAKVLIENYLDLTEAGLLIHYQASPQKYLDMLRSNITLFDYCKRYR